MIALQHNGAERRSLVLLNRVPLPRQAGAAPLGEPSYESGALPLFAVRETWRVTCQVARPR